MNTFRINCDITKEEYFDFNKHNLLETPSGRKSLMLFRMIVPVIFLIFFVFNAFRNPDITYLIVMAVLLTVIGLVYWFNAHRMVLGIFRLQMKSQDDLVNDLLGKSVVTFDFENGLITDISEKEEVRVRFENVMAVYEADKAFYVYYNNIKAFVIPYRSFGSAEEFRAFQGLLRSSFAKTAHYPTVR